jgi:hypothetical protein
MAPEPVVIVAKLVRVLDSLGIPYLVGGSLASSVYGMPRATQDVDIVADIRTDHIDAIVRDLAGEFYVDAEMIQEAVRERGSFNALHASTMFRLDVFIPSLDDWSREELRRARAQRFETDEGPIEIRFASPEDTLLHKLWYKLGNEVSDRQWNDILGILKIQGAALDRSYLVQWAPSLSVADLLHRAELEATGPR